LPNATTTLVGTSDTATLTNKTVALGSNTVSGTTAQFNTALTDGDFATLAGSETLTTKTIALGSNTVSGTTAQFNTALTDNDFATLAGSETLTNKSIAGSANTLTAIPTAALDNDAVTNAKLANIATATIKGRVTASTGDPEDLSGTQATTLLDVFTTSLKGLAPSSGGGTTNYLRADGTWAAPSGGGGPASDAEDVAFADTGSDYTATDVEAALTEVMDAHLAHVADSSAAHAASAISIADAGSDFTATTVEGALDELQADHEADVTALSDHIADSSAAHAASAISYGGGTGMSATDVEAAIDELATEKSDTTHNHSGTYQPLDTDLTTLATAFLTASASGPASLALAEDTDNGSNKVTITAPAAITSDRVLTLLDATTTIVGHDTSQTLTTKTIALGSNTVSGTTAQFNTALTDNDFATLAGSETLTTKTMALGSNTVTGTTAQFNTALTDNDFATLAGSETLTTKTMALGSNTVTGTTAQFNTALTDNDFATQAGSETLTNKTIAGGSNTISGIDHGSMLTGLTDDDHTIYYKNGSALAGRTIWIQASDPAGSATNGDIWFDIP
jgi:hypothetical protein